MMIEKISDILIVTDMDGTLLREKDGISEENLEAIKYFTEKGGHFTVSTGRAYDDAFKKIVEKVPVNAPSMHINGGYLYDWKAEKILEPSYISKYAKYSCEKILKKFPDCDCHFAGEKPIMLMTGGKVLREYIPNREFSFFEGEFEDIPENVLKYVICCSPEIMNEVREYAKDVCSNDVSIVQSSEFFLEILPKNNSKGNALKKLCSIMSIPVENSVAVGDYENDISMIMTAGLGAAVDNAMPDVKEAADIVLPACEENAVANLIYFLEEMYG